MDSHKKLWFILTIAGLLEIVWAVALGMSDGFNKPLYLIVVVVFLGFSIYLLSTALEGGLPAGTAYSVWVGIGAVGTVTISILMGMESATLLKIVFIAMIISGIIGLQVTCDTAECD